MTTLMASPLHHFMNDNGTINTMSSISRERLSSMPPGGVATQLRQQPAGPWAQFPWTGVSALAGAVCGIAVCVGILVASDGNSINQWRYQPTVYLSVAYTITNLLVGLAFREGVIVNWWRTAQDADTTLGDLHRRYEYGQSIWSAILAGRKMNLVAIAAILCAIVPVNGPLLQRASTIGEEVQVKPGTMKIAAATVLDSYTGFITGRNYAVSFMTPAFQTVAQAFADGAAIYANDTGCSGSATCSGKLTALGISVRCNHSLPLFNLEPKAFGNGSVSLPSASVFTTSFGWSLQHNPNEISLLAAFKNGTACSGELVQHNCTLTPATVQYPIIMDGNASTITLDPQSTIWDDTIVNSTISESYEPLAQGPVHLGGYWMTLRDQLSSSMELYFSGAVGYSISTDGAMSFPGRFADYSAATTNGAISPSQLCNITFGDPLPYMLNQARNLMFRKALADGNNSTIQTVHGQEIITENVFHSHYLFLGIALGVTLIAIVIISGTFYGYWQVTRPATMNPLVLAQAFDSPLLRDVQPNAKSTELAKSLGNVPVRLRAVFQAASGGLSEREQYELSDRACFGKEAGVIHNPYGQSQETLVTAPSTLRDIPMRWPLQ